MSGTDVTATLRYLAPGQDNPVYVASTGGADAALNIGADFDDHEVVIRDARDRDTSPTLDREGFCLRRQPTAIEDFYALEAQRAVYEAELRDLVVAETGAGAALVFDHTLRSDSRAVRGERSTREPASVIHNDYTDRSAAKRLRDLLPAEEAGARLSRRFAIVNVWRSIGPPVLNSPLACCDAGTVDPADLVASERRAEERVGELQLVRFNPDHRWYYFPQMTRDEALLLKTFDSATDGRARRVVHSAFDNPRAPADAPARESIESRLLVFFGE
jgi:hypothetical protein